MEKISEHHHNDFVNKFAGYGARIGAFYSR